MKQEVASQKNKEIKGLEMLLDVPLQVTVELGRTKMTIRELLKLGEGSIVELPTAAGEPLEVLVNQKPIAKGEVVVVNEKYGIRLLSIISEMERIEQLK
ncbi:MAG: flagellar motor switch protein FliN [Deltaproteobacteria bacterium]|nr:flagellar motor switch protein FliN [Deltaproteobacteria bacterium]MDL1971662.1 flagellar motor switch protein FliN [Deltaproteobacteria bacterium]